MADKSGATASMGNQQRARLAQQLQISRQNTRTERTGKRSREGKSHLAGVSEDNSRRETDSKAGQRRERRE